MKITFIRPNMMNQRRSASALEPLVFALLAGLTPPEVELELFDEYLEPIPFDRPTDLVAMTIETFAARRAYQVAAQYRRRGTPVVAGGYHPSFLPHEALQFVDAVVIGDAENIWPQVVQDARQGRLQRVYRNPSQPSLAGLRFDRRLFAGKRYMPMALMQYGRGCRFACDFCSIHSFYGTHTRQRPIADVIAELETLNAKFVFFVDDNLIFDRAGVMALFDALTPLRIRWVSQVSINTAQDEALLKAMARSGCFGVAVGLESLSANNLRLMKKGWNYEHSDYVTALNKFQDHGLLIYGSFVFGYDHDTLDTFERTAEFAHQARLALSNFASVVPTPGAALHERLQQEKRLRFNRWWLHPDYRYGQALFRPAQMTVEQLEQGCLRARRLFYSARSILARALDRRANGRSLDQLAFFLGANLVSRWEIDHKLGQPLAAPHPLIPALENEPLLDDEMAAQLPRAAPPFNLSS